MVDLMAYLGQFTNSLIRCLEQILETIFYIPLLDTYLGNIIFSLIIIMFAINLFRKWILGSYSKDHSKKNKEVDNK